MTFSQIEYSNKKRQTKKEIFLSTMEEVIPWSEWLGLIKPYYPIAGGGRRPIDMEIMLRMYLIQNWYNLSDEATEEAIYDIQPIRNFVGIDLITSQAPDATTLLRFRHLLEEHNLTEKFFKAINRLMEHNGYILKEGTITDATIFQASSSTKNEMKERDPEMASTKKGNNYFFGMKAHIGVDADTGLVHSLETTAANVHDITVAHKLLHGEEEFFYGDSAYVGIGKREEFKDKSHLSLQVIQRRSKFKNLPETQATQELLHHEKEKSKIRAKGEHPFHIVKNIFGYKKTVYKGLHKNTTRMFTLFACANLVKLRYMGLSLQP